MLSLFEIWAVAQERQQAAWNDAARERALKRWGQWMARAVRRQRDETAIAAARPEAAFIGLMMKGSR